MLNKLRKAVETVGGTLEQDSNDDWTVYQCIAPKGKIWDCCSIHMLKVEWRTNDKVYKTEAIQDAIERVSYGVSDCEDTDCDFCNDN